MRHWTVALVCTVIVASGCSGDESSADLTTTTSTLAAGAGDTESDDDATTTPPTTAVPTTAEPTTPPTVGNGLTAECLQGEWIMSQEDTDLFIATLVPFAPVSIPQGSLSMTFEGDRVRFFTNIVARFSVPEGEVEGPLDLLQEGSYVIAGRDLKIALDNVEGGWGNFTGNIGGVSVNVPVPAIGEFPPLAGGPAECDGDRFSLQYTSGVSNAIAFFQRAS